MNMLIRIVCVHFFSGSLLRFRKVSSTTFCIVEKTLHLLYPFSGVHLGLGLSRAGGNSKSCPVFIKFFHVGVYMLAGCRTSSAPHVYNLYQNST